MFTWLFGSGDKPPIFLQFRSSKTFIIIVVASAVFTDIFAYGIGTFFSLFLHSTPLLLKSPGRIPTKHTIINTMMLN